MSDLQPMDNHISLSRNPIREAQQWVDLQVIPKSHCWVLGLGAGFHVTQLALKRPDLVISVVEHRPALIEMFYSDNPQLTSQVIVEAIANESELLASKSFGLFGKNLSSVHLFRPSIQGFEKQYGGFSASLRGQTEKSFSTLAKLFGLSINKEQISQFKFFHIKEVNSALQSQGTDSTRALVKVLMELIV